MIMQTYKSTFETKCVLSREIDLAACLVKMAVLETPPFMSVTVT